MAAVINKLVEAVGDLELRQLFTMRQIRMGRVRPGALVDPTTGKLPMQHITLADMFDQQRKQFVQQLMQEIKEEQDAHARAQAADADSGNDQGSGEGEQVKGEATANGHDHTAEHIVGPRIVTES